jgi:fatty-acyl-CoA synthase
VVTDRLPDVIRSGGEWISSLEVDNAALQPPSISQAAVIAMPHPRWGERALLVATVQSSDIPPVDEPRRRHGGVCPTRWSFPDCVLFVSELPTGPTGKVLKRELRALLDPRGTDTPASGSTGLSAWSLS